MKRKGKIDAILDAQPGGALGPSDSKILKEYCVASAGGHLVGIQIEYLREVFDIRAKADIVPVPFLPPHLAGIVNVRGEILPVVDFAMVLGFPGRGENAKMLVMDALFKAAFPAEDIFDLVQRDVSEVRELKGAGAAGFRFISGEFKIGERSVFVIDVLKLFESEYLSLEGET